MAAIANNEWVPRKLEEEEIEDPFLVIFRFFDYADLASQREHLWEWLKTMVAGTFSSELLNKHKRYDMIFFHEHLEKLIEAAHLLLLQHSRPRKQKQKQKKKKKG